MVGRDVIDVYNFLALREGLKLCFHRKLTPEAKAIRQLRQGGVLSYRGGLGGRSGEAMAATNAFIAGAVIAEMAYQYGTRRR